MGERSKDLTIYAGLYGTPAGICSYGKDLHENILKEIKEEVRMQFEVKMMKATYLGRNADDLHPELLFFIYATANNIGKEELKANWEYKGKKVKLVEIGSEEHLHYLTLFINEIPKEVVKRKDIEKYWKINKTPKWVPAHWIASALTLFFKP